VPGHPNFRSEPYSVIEPHRSISDLSALFSSKIILNFSLFFIGNPVAYSITSGALPSQYVTLSGCSPAKVTEDMAAAADPQYLAKNYDLPMDEASRMARAKAMGLMLRTRFIMGRTLIFRILTKVSEGSLPALNRVHRQYSRLPTRPQRTSLRE